MRYFRLLHGWKRTVRTHIYIFLEFAEFTSESKERAFVYYKSIQEIASAIYQWADRNAKIGSIETLVDICEDTDNKAELFYKMPIEIVTKACYALQEVGKAEVFASSSGESIGVKFFHHG